MSTLMEILEHNLIICGNEDMGMIVTANGAYFQIWRQLERGSFECLEAYTFSDRVNTENGLYGADASTILDQAEKLLKEFTKESDEE